MRRLVQKMKGPSSQLRRSPRRRKTSLAKSIARATGRNFVRLSWEVRDEAEIRGHRRLPTSAPFPGQIIQMMRKARFRNPVFLLDEVDKMAADFGAIPRPPFEVLDPEQNNAFLDHYLDTEYDLSDVMFIATANVMHTITPPSATAWR